jgi:hypothetical protein
MILRVSLLAAILVSLAFSPAASYKSLESRNLSETQPEAVPDGLATTSNFYSFRRDLRRCASPRCGGYFVKLVNQARTRCADNRFQAECYVSEINWGSETQPDNEQGLLRGSISARRGFGVFRATEVWQAASSNAPAGKFFRVRDRGIRCIAAPCATHSEATLNLTTSRNIAGVDLSGARAPENAVSEAIRAMTSSDGILVSGDHSLVTGPAGRMQMLKASQFYLRAGDSVDDGGGGGGGQKPCMKTGCSGQVCSDQEVITTCEFRTEYECYKRAACERQRNGECGFTMTRELSECLRRARGN